MPMDLGTKIRVKRAPAHISQRALARLQEFFKMR